MLLVALIAALAGLGFTIDQIAHPPAGAFALPLGFARPVTANSFAHALASAAGVGETLAAAGVAQPPLGERLRGAAQRLRISAALPAVSRAPDIPSVAGQDDGIIVCKERNSHVGDPIWHYQAVSR